MVVLTVALVPTMDFGNAGDGVISRTTSSSMESVYVEVENTDNARGTFTVVAIGAASDTPVAGVRLLPGANPEIDGGQSARVLAVFQDLRPGEVREARVCYAPVNLPANRTCRSFAIERI